MSYRLLGTKRWSTHNFVRATGSKSGSKSIGFWSATRQPRQPDIIIDRTGALLGRRHYTLLCVNSPANGTDQKLVSGKCVVGTGECGLEVEICTN